MSSAGSYLNGLLLTGRKCDVGVGFSSTRYRGGRQFPCVRHPRIARRSSQRIGGRKASQPQELATAEAHRWHYRARRTSQLGGAAWIWAAARAAFHEAGSISANSAAVKAPTRRQGIPCSRASSTRSPRARPLVVMDSALLWGRCRSVDHPGTSSRCGAVRLLPKPRPAELPERIRFGGSPMLSGASSPRGTSRWRG